MDKPMGNFAENLNLGKCVLPRPPVDYGILRVTNVSILKNIPLGAARKKTSVQINSLIFQKS